ncbi:MAG: hypothetical protein CMJ18_10010 [Phycisphaeraceae bacterium]|nr:hypothetical protein [Phycisphaeraceae bacterium]
MSAAVRLICPNLKCRSVLSVPPKARGKTVRCRRCRMRIQVPMSKTGEAPPEQMPDGAEAENTEEPEGGADAAQPA